MFDAIAEMLNAQPAVLEFIFLILAVVAFIYWQRTNKSTNSKILDMAVQRDESSVAISKDLLRLLAEQQEMTREQKDIGRANTEAVIALTERMAAATEQDRETALVIRAFTSKVRDEHAIAQAAIDRLGEAQTAQLTMVQSLDAKHDQTHAALPPIRDALEHLRGLLEQLIETVRTLDNSDIHAEIVSLTQQAVGMWAMLETIQQNTDNGQLNLNPVDR
jgi:hypothetical protein